MMSLCRAQHFSILVKDWCVLNAELFEKLGLTRECHSVQALNLRCIMLLIFKNNM